MNRKEAIEIVRSNFPNGRIQLSEALKILIPELKESEDEKIRKEILNYFKDLDEHGYPTKEWTAWVEKQGDKYPVNFNEAEQEKYDFVSGQFIECRASFNEFKEDNSYWFEYVGDDTYIGRSDNILNKKFHITPRQLFTLFTQQHCPKEDNNVNEEINSPTEYGKYVDECLDEAAKHFYSKGEDKYSVADLFHAGVRCGKSLLEKQGEQKPKEEIKFYDSMDDLIADALIEEIEKSELNDKSKHNRIFWIKSHRQKPTWNDENKKMFKSIIECIDGTGLLDSDQIDWLKSFKAKFEVPVKDDKTLLEKQGEQKSVEWSEEDKGFIDLLLAIFTNEHPNGLFTTGNITVFNGNHVSSNRIVTWLKSFKPQIHWKPSEEQIKALKHFVRSIGESSYAYYYDNNIKLIHSLLNDLKKL